MLRNLMLTIALILLAVSVPFGELHAHSPKGLVEEYWRMETTGGRLTPEGWKKANAYYLQPVPPPQKRIISVIDDDFAVWNPIIRGSHASVMIGARLLGNIDSSLRYTPHHRRQSRKGFCFD